MDTKNKDEPGMDLKILQEIKEAEKKAEGIIEKSKEEKDSIIHDAVVEASKNFSKKSEEIRALQEKKVSDFKNELKNLRQDIVKEGDSNAKQIKSKSSKKLDSASEFIMKKFEEMSNA